MVENHIFPGTSCIQKPLSHSKWFQGVFYDNIKIMKNQEFQVESTQTKGW